MVQVERQNNAQVGAYVIAVQNITECNHKWQIIQGRKEKRMKIGDRVYVHGYVDEIRIDTVIIRNEGGYFGTVKSEIVEAQKTEDIVSVIRCRDCKYRYTDGESVTANYCLLAHNRVQADDWFCADAEREE